MRRILANPIYYGHFRYAGEVFEGRHQPLITKQLFDRVQAVRERRTKHHRKERVPKPFTQLLQCGECGMMVTAEIQKGHTYYRCSRKAKVGCTQPYVREEALDGQLSDMRGGFSLPAAWAEEMLRKLDAEERTQSQSSRTRLHEKQTALTAIAAKLQKLLDAYLEGLIDREAFTERKAALMGEKKGLREEIKNLEDHRALWLELMRNWIQRAGNTGETAKTGSLHEKKRLASDIFGSNLTLVGKKARGSALKSCRSSRFRRIS